MVFEFKYPIGYLEFSDFDEKTGMLTGELAKSPVFVMIQADYCGACSKVKPEFQKLANNGKFHVMNIQIDGKRESEKKILSILDVIIPNTNSIPAFVLFSQGKKIKYKGAPNAQEFLNFVNQNI
jgi:thiol-disulfide isomerase/thioredoxin